MIETDLLQSYFISSLPGFRQFAGRFGDQVFKIIIRFQVVVYWDFSAVKEHFNVFFLVDGVIKPFSCLAFLWHFQNVFPAFADAGQHPQNFSILHKRSMSKNYPIYSVSAKSPVLQERSVVADSPRKYF